MAPAARTKHVVKRLCPPAVLKLLRGRPFSRQLVWEGIYKDRRSVPATDDRYDSNARVSEFVESARRARALMRAGKPMDVPCAWHDALCLLAASIASQPYIRVLDFGGGVGFAFLQLLSSLRAKTAVCYHVIDLENMCIAGRELFADDLRIQFHSTWPALEGNIDIVYASTVLPYIDDYVGLLRQFAAVKARFILLNQLATGNFLTYAAKQLNLPGQVLAYWFLNIQEVIDVLAAAGYSCMYEAQVGHDYDQSNYPELYRLGRMRTMFFVRR